MKIGNKIQYKWKKQKLDQIVSFYKPKYKLFTRIKTYEFTRRKNLSVLNCYNIFFF